MRIDPALKSLRGDQAAQRRATEAMENGLLEWRSLPLVAEIQGDLHNFAQGDEVANLPSLTRLFGSTSQSREFVSTWTKRFLDLLRDEPLGVVPFSPSSGSGVTSLQLMASGDAAITLLTYVEANTPQEETPAIASFADRELHEVAIAGEAQACEYRRDDASGSISCEDFTWRPGEARVTRGISQARQIHSVSGSFSLLQLSRTLPNAVPTCEYRIADGALLYRSSGEKWTSQTEMALAVLGQMERPDALPEILSLVLRGPAQLRWEALRQAIALDATAGFEALTTIAADPADELRAQASELRRSLMRRFPQLNQIGAEPCPA